MRRAISAERAGLWKEADALASVTLAFDDRHRRRIRLIDDGGEPFMLDLPQATQLNHGDGLALESGGMVKVYAAPEEVLDIICTDPVHTARVAWHIGNRHMPTQVLNEFTLRITYDHVLQHMIEGLGAKTERKTAPFAPESGAYSEGTHGHGHDH